MLKVKNTTETQKSVSYLDLEIDNGGRLKTKLKTNVMTLPFHWSVSHSSVAIFQYRVYISQPIRYPTICAQYSDCLCLICSMLVVSLDCPFLTSPLVFSNVYLYNNNLAKFNQHYMENVIPECCKFYTGYFSQYSCHLYTVFFDWLIRHYMTRNIHSMYPNYTMFQNMLPVKSEEEKTSKNN